MKAEALKRGRGRRRGRRMFSAFNPQGPCRTQNGGRGTFDGHSNVASLAACQSLCLQDSRCLAIEYPLNASRCEIHRATITYAASGAARCYTFSPTSGLPNVCPSSVMDVDCLGNDLTNHLNTALDACCALCSAQPACTHFTLSNVTMSGADPGSNTCFLKQGDCSNQQPFSVWHRDTSLATTS